MKELVVKIIKQDFIKLEKKGYMELQRGFV